MHETLDLRHIAPKTLYPLGEKFSGRAPDGIQIGFTNYYMTKNDAPFFGVAGEVHYSRVSEDQWEDTILKCKMGGLNIIATYVFWNVHEEIEGKFRFDGNRNLRKFLDLCRKHGMYVIVRIGPFDHGEMRNGGMPDWLYGMPFEVRDRSEAFYRYVRRLFHQLHEQMNGLYFSQGGPVIGTQIENEYMHSSAAWEITTGISNEWINGGKDREAYMLDLKKIAVEEGIVTPFYTCTAWGGAMTPTEEMLPLWGGYAYWPWIFYNTTGEHPLTPEYIYRDNHNNEAPKTYNFEPRYEPESRPYSCCEMMGGMACCYNYRFVLPPESVDAMANIKLGSGCNLLGYYMYRGGTTPTGERTPFLNEAQVPKRSYDYQAVLSEYGLPRRSYFRLRLLHTFVKTFCKELSSAKTVLPPYMDGMEPSDHEKLRYCVRYVDGAGFVFLNNFQDHDTRPVVSEASIELLLPEETIRFEHIGLADGENAILPFNLRMGNVLLKHATLQPITQLQADGKTYWFFFAPDGMTPEYAFDGSGITAVDGEANTKAVVTIHPSSEAISQVTITNKDETHVVITLPRAAAERFMKCEIHGREAAFLSETALLWDGKTLRTELTGRDTTVLAFPNDFFSNFEQSSVIGLHTEPVCDGLFRGYRLTRDHAEQDVAFRPVGPSRYVLDVEPELLSGHKQTLLRTEYYGDIGQLFINGQMLSDNFYNTAAWIARLDPYQEQLKTYPLTVYITPVRENAKVDVSSTMAGRMERLDGAKAELYTAKLQFVDEVTLPIS